MLKFYRGSFIKVSLLCSASFIEVSSLAHFACLHIDIWYMVYKCYLLYTKRDYWQLYIPISRNIKSQSVYDNTVLEIMVDDNAVYISFNRSEDTIRHSFLSHLSANFHRRGISWEDPETDRDRDATTIAKSKVIVVILSDEYALSKSCLDELLIVSQCRGSNDLAVVPVFYGLTKLALRKQCLKLKTLYSGVDMIAGWRRALLDIADLPGHASSLERSDNELIEEIVADVRQKLDLTGKIGIYSRLLKIENLLCKQPWGVRSLGIWGMGGIGKTTLADAAYKQLSGKFEASCVIKDFDNAFKEKGVYGLLEENLAGKLHISSPVTREKLCDKRILLVLDDVHNPLGATKFLGWFELIGPGSIIIITSRDKQLLVQCRVNDIYKVQGLNEHEARQLFSRCAYGKDGPNHHHLLKLSCNLVDCANGNPLALSVYGRELEGKTSSEIESEVRKLEQHFPDKIFDVLKRSYDAISDSDKEILLNIIFSFRGENVDNVKQFLSGCGFFPHVGIDVLVNKSLVTVSESRLQIHNLIHKVGLKIIKDQIGEIGKGYTLLDDSNIQSLVEEHEIEENHEDPKTTRNLGNEDIKAIILDTYNLSFKGLIAFQDMYKLRYLKTYSSKPDFTEDLELCFPEDGQSLPPKLRFLHWENYPSQAFPQDFDVQHLVELIMPHSKLLRLWEGTKSLKALKRITLSHSQQLVNVDELQYSRNIENIDLQGCSSLQSFPDMDQLQHLQVLDLSSCIKIESVPKVPPSIKKLHLQGTGIRKISFLNHASESEDFSDEESNLEELTSQVNVSSSNQDDLLDMVSFESLEVLGLSGCSEVEEIQSFPQNLKELYLAKISIKEIPSSLFHHLSELVTLDMEDCKRLRDLPMGMGNMKSLATLKLSGCSMLENIQDLPRNLKELYLAGTAIKEFPSPLLERLSELVILSLENCKLLHSLPMKMSKLKSLVTLTLSGCSKLETIHDFPQSLKEVYLVGTAIRELPSSIVDMAELAILDLKNCKSLQHLPEGMQNLNPLDVLDLSDCSKLEVSISSLPQAKVRRLDGICTSDRATENEAQKTSDMTREDKRGMFTGRSFTHRLMEKVKYLKTFF